jgi:hypothetical protein
MYMNDVTTLDVNRAVLRGARHVIASLCVYTMQLLLHRLLHYAGLFEFDMKP